jgi:predicted outer membrane repeat protein
MRLAAAVSLGVLVLLSYRAFGDVYVVDPHGTGDFPTIQAAVDAAADGDIIELTDGTFTGDGNRDVDLLNKSLTVRSQGGPEVCIIDCDGSASEPHRAFVQRLPAEPDPVLEGMTIVNGYHVWGGAVYLAYSSPTIADCVFRENVSPGSEGGAICCEESASPYVVGCFFSDNSAQNGGAVAVCAAGYASFVECTFVRNRAFMGGGIRL